MFFSALIQPTSLAVLAISALTAGWQAYQMGLFDSAKETRDLDKELNDFTSTLNSVKKAQLEANQTSIKEIQTFKLLQKQVEAVGLSKEKRLLAVKEIKKEWPEYIKGLSDEQILAGKVGDAYIKLTEGIKAGARARVFSQKIAENDLKIEELKFLQQEKGLAIAQKLREQEKARAQDEQRRAIGAAAGGFGSAAISEAATIQSEIVNLVQEVKISEQDIKKIKAENLILDSKITNNLVKAGGLLDDNLKPIKEANKEFDLQVAILDRFNNKVELSKTLTDGLSKEQRNLFETIVKLKQAGDVGFNPTLLAIYEEKLKEIDDKIGSIASKFKEVEIDIDPTKLEGLEAPTTKEIQDPGIIEGLQQHIASFEKLKQVTSDPTMLALYTLQIDLLKNKLAEFNGEEVKSNLQLIADAFGSMGQQIANSLNISNKSLRGFVTTLVSATPKIVAAILAKSKATAAGAETENIANAKLAAGNSVVVATEGAKGLGPIGLALLPVFIAGALALVSSAFGKAGGGGGSPSAGSGSTFTNRREFGGPVSKGRAYIVGEKRPELFVPNTNGIIVPQVPSMDYSGASMAAGAMAVDVNIRGVSYGDDILFTVQQAQIRRGIR
jgi:hypothetical protein